MSEESKLLDCEEVSLRMGLSSRTLRRLVDSGKAPSPIRIGHSIRWPAKQIAEWIDGGCKSLN